MNIQKLTEAGVNYNSGIERFMGNNELYETVLKAFLSDKEFLNATEAYENHDFDTMFKALHTLKGIAGSLSIDNLFVQTSKVVAILRKQAEGDLESEFSLVKKLYNIAFTNIQSALKE
ncbi:MAG: hypothetical protein RR123_02910 [Clostridia bacterium]